MSEAEAPERTPFEEHALEVTKNAMRCVPADPTRNGSTTNGYGYGTETFRAAHIHIERGMLLARQTVLDVFDSRQRSMRRLLFAVLCVGVCAGYFIRVLMT